MKRENKNHFGASSQIQKRILSCFHLAKSNLQKMKDASLASLYTVKQVSSAVQISERAIRQAISDGRLDVIRIGKSVRISKPAIAAWLCITVDEISGVLPPPFKDWEGPK